MKLLTFITIFTLVNGCNSQNETEDITIFYEAITRGSLLEISATSNKVIYKSLDVNKTISPKAVHWENLTNLIKEINVSEIENFKPPSNNRSFDAALHATLTLTIDNQTYKSQTFDHGNPPDELKEIVEKLLSLIK